MRRSAVPRKDSAATLWDPLCKDTDKLQFNPCLDLSDWGITPQLQNRWKSPDKAGGGEREKARMYTRALSMKTQDWLS